MDTFDPQDPRTAALIAMGLQLMQSKPYKSNALNDISQAGLFGMQTYNQQLTAAAKAREEQQQAQARDIALQKQMRLMELLSGGGAQTQTAAPQPTAPRPSMMDAPGWASNPLSIARPAPAAPAAPASSSMAQKLLAAGFTKEAEEYAKAEGAIHGEAYGGIQVTQGGKPYYMTKQGPRYVADGSFVPREELHFGDTGDRTNVGFDKFTGAPRSQGVAKGMSPAEKDAAARGWSQFGLERDKFNRGELRNDVPLADGGTGIGFITPDKGFMPVPGTGSKQKEEPATIRMAISNNNVALAKIDRALELVDAHPEAFGVKNMIGDTVRQRTNPEGVEARAAVSDFGSLKIHDRTGANMTASEAPRLQPFVPNVNDSPETIKKKLALGRREYALMQEELQGGKTLNQVATPANRNVGKISGAEAEAELLRRGKRP